MSIDDSSTLRKRALELLNGAPSSSSTSASPSSIRAGSTASSPASSPTKKQKKKKSKYANAPALFLGASSASTSMPASPSLAATGSANGTSTQPLSPSKSHDSNRNASVSHLARMLSKVDPHIVEQRKNLPIWAGKEAIVEAVRDNDTVVILGETGSGKTTQIPQFLFEAGFAQDRPVQMIGVTQPRRVAATSLARRVAVEMGAPDPASRSLQDPSSSSKGKAKEAGPGLVGYSIRFDDRTSKRTRIKFMTDGMVLREMIGNGEFSHLSQGDDGDKRGGHRLQSHTKKRERDGDESSSTKAVSSTLLSRYSVLIIDEAHERTLRTDMVLGLAKRIQRERKALRADWIRRGRPSDEPEVTELKLVVMSATLDARSFANFFSSPSAALSESMSIAPASSQAANGRSDVPILYVKGRQHGVTTFHTEEPSQEWTDAALRTILQIHVSRPPGDVLVFMTGQEEIETLAKSLETYARDLPQWAEHEKRPAPPLELMIAPLYAALGPSASVKVFAATPPRTRKVVLATNIAETSITIPGIVYVIDCGLAKEKIYTPVTGVESLQTQEISQSAARQRAGRAGRERAGECYRLYTDEAFKSLPQTTTPEILRTDLAGAVLQLCAMGQDPYRFDWMDQPDAHGLRDAVIQLIQLGALEIRNKPSPASTATAASAAANAASSTPAVSAQLVLTAVGQKMAMLPVAPFYARALVAASRRGPKVARQVRDMIAVLSADRSVLLDPSDPEKRDEANKAKAVFVHPSGDHGTLLNVLYAYLAETEAARKIYRTTNKTKSTSRLEAVVEEDDDDATSPASSAAKKGARIASSAAIEMREHVKAWCQNHFVLEKAVRNVLHIRKQLSIICAQQGIECDDTLALREKAAAKAAAKGRSGFKAAGGRKTSADSSSSDQDDDEDEEEEETTNEDLQRLRSLKSGLHVVRKGVNDLASLSSSSAAAGEETYADLLKCLLEGRFANAALRTAEGGSWKRTGGGQPFRLHPSSTLHASRRRFAESGKGGGGGGGGGKMEALLVEEVVVTTQTYGRICSVVEPGWVQEVMLQSSSSSSSSGGKGEGGSMAGK